MLSIFDFTRYPTSLWITTLVNPSHRVFEFLWHAIYIMDVGLFIMRNFSLKEIFQTIHYWNERCSERVVSNIRWCKTGSVPISFSKFASLTFVYPILRLSWFTLCDVIVGFNLTHTVNITIMISISIRLQKEHKLFKHSDFVYIVIMFSSFFTCWKVADS